MKYGQLFSACGCMFLIGMLIPLTLTQIEYCRFHCENDNDDEMPNAPILKQLTFRLNCDIVEIADFCAEYVYKTIQSPQVFSCM